MQQPKDYVMEASEFLQQAQDTMLERGKTYDSENKERSMGKTIQMFNIATGHNLKESDGWLIMKLLKDVRQYSNKEYHHDSAIDGVAYSALHAESLIEGK